MRKEGGSEVMVVKFCFISLALSFSLSRERGRWRGRGGGTQKTAATD
jgi:hypothetical protein